MTNLNTIRGGISILGILFFGFIIILILSYFHVSIRTVVESPTGQDNITYVKGSTTGFWDKYLKEPAAYLWNDVWLKIFWRPFISNMEKIRDGQPTDMEKSANSLKLQY